MNSQDLKKIKLPEAPGVYLFKNNKDILYIGKATSIKDRVKSYFAKDLIATRGPLLVDMVFKANKIDFIKTDSVLEALILEASLIKQNQPRYNTKEKDDRSYNYVVITKEDFPRVLIERGKNINFEELTVKGIKLKSFFGPFTNGTQLKEALNLVRKIFPFRDKCNLEQDRACFNYQIGLCPGTCIGALTKADYKKTIKNIELFFSGKKTSILKNLEKEMKIFAKKHEFEKANVLKKTIFALNHIQDVALIKSDDGVSDRASFRVEAYDVAHISGTSTVGVMVVVEDGQVNKNEYRKFKINNSVQNDILGLQEILERRFTHEEWRFPDLMVVDGSLAQKNIAEKVLKKLELKIPVIAVTKDERHRPKMLQGLSELVTKYENEILMANSEAHRFAIKYHREMRGKNSLI